MDLVDRPNTSPNVIICGSPSSIWTPSCVVAPGISCLVPILNFNAFGLAFAFPCTPRRSDRIRQRLPASRIFSFPPSWKSKTAKTDCSSHPSTCLLLPTSELSGILVSPCLWDKQACLQDCKSATPHVAGTWLGRTGPNITRCPGQEHNTQEADLLKTPSQGR
jgi:hypothetical protein